MTGDAGSEVWMMTSPGTARRPARPATCVMSWKARSAARKSGLLTRLSALRMPTSETPSKSNPFEIICVPTRMSVSWRAKPATMLRKARSEVTLSRSSRATRARGKRRAISSSTFSVPKPRGARSVTRHAGHFTGTASVWPQ